MASLEPSNIISEQWYGENITLEVNTSRVATLCLNRPDKHNALNANMLNAMNLAFDRLEQYHSENHGNVRLLLLRANGKSFCAGADLNSMQKMINFSYDDNYQDAVDLARVLERFSDFPCPTIAVIQGNAFGGGVGFICAADYALAIVDAKFSLSEVKLGLIPAVISPYLVSCLGYKSAMRLALSAEMFDATKAHQLNMVSHLVKDQKSLELEIEKLEHQLLINGPIAMQAAKSLFKQIYNNEDPAELLALTAEKIAAIRISAEGQEGLLAFLEQRKPHWIIDKKT